MHEFVAAGLGKVQQVLQQLILVFICHSLHGVTDITSIVLDDELTLATFEVGVLGQEVKPANESLIGRTGISVSSCTGIVQSGEDTRGALVLDQRAHHLVVKVFNRSPLDLLAGIFILFCLESQLNENLLQLFVDIVNTQLLERVLLEDFESVNIQDTNRIRDRAASSQ